MKDKKLFILVSVLLICCCLVVLYQDSYAKYKKKVDQNVGITLASWTIKLNNESVAGKETVTGNIIPTFLESEYTAENVIAPGSSGYFDITINPSNVDLSFDYKFVCSTRNEQNLVNNYLQKQEDYATMIFVIGPEGGISPREEDLLEDYGYIPITLGNRIMRVETAAIYIASIINFCSNS